jgi:hypothetical protein
MKLCVSILLSILSIIILIVIASIPRNAIQETFSFNEPFPLQDTDLICKCPNGQATSIDGANKNCLYCEDKEQVLYESKDGLACFDIDTYDPQNVRPPINECSNSKQLMEINNIKGYEDGLYCYNCPKDFPSGTLNPFNTWIGDIITCENNSGETELAQDIVKIDKCPNQELIDDTYCADKCKEGYQLALINGYPKCVGYINPVEPQTTGMECIRESDLDLDK